MQKNVSDNKESIHIEISGSSFSKNKNFSAENSDYEETD